MLQALLRMVKVAEFACVEALFDRKCNDSWIGSWIGTCRLNRGRRLA